MYNILGFSDCFVVLKKYTDISIKKKIYCWYAIWCDYSWMMVERMIFYNFLRCTSTNSQNSTDQIFVCRIQHHAQRNIYKNGDKISKAQRYVKRWHRDERNMKHTIYRIYWFRILISIRDFFWNQVFSRFKYRGLKWRNRFVWHIAWQCNELVTLTN